MDRLRQFLQRLDSRDASRTADTNGQPPSSGPSSINGDSGVRKAVPIPMDKGRDICPGVPTSQRVKALRELADFVASNRLVDKSVEILFTQTADILNAMFYGLGQETQKNSSTATNNGTSPAEVQSTAAPLELKQATWIFYIKLIGGQMENLHTMRAVFFNLIRNYPKNYTDEVIFRLEMLKTLTENGKNLAYFRDEIGEFMLQCYIDEILPAQSTLSVPFLLILINIVKLNSPYLDQKTIAGVIEATCKLIENTKREDVRTQCLVLFEVIPSFSYLPPETLNSFTESLCLTVNLPEHRESTWKIMSSVLVAHLGHAVVKSLCVFLQDRIYHGKVSVLRGAIHFIGMSLWGDQRVSTLKHKPDAILPSFVQACDSRSPVVGCEVAIAVHLLVRKQGTDLQIYTWSVIIDICDMLVTNFDGPQLQQQLSTDSVGRQVITTSSPGVDLNAKVHVLLTEIEKLQRENCFLGSVDKFYSVLEKCSLARPEDSVNSLIEYRAHGLDPSKANWIESLKKFMDTFFKCERRTSVRLRALEVVSSVLSAYRHTHEELLIDSVVAEYFGQIHRDSDWKIRERVVQLLVDILQECKITKKCSEMLEIVRQVLNRPFMAREDIVNVMGDNELSDTMTAVSGLVSVFQVQLRSAPAFAAVEAYKILINHLERLYTDRRAGQEMSVVKEKIFDFLLRIRANGLGQVALYSKKDELEFSPFVLCSMSSEVSSPTSGTSNALSPPSTPLVSQAGNPASSNPFSTTFSNLSLADMYTVITTGLKNEKSWPILRLVLTGLKELLANKPSVMFSRLKRQDNKMENKVANDLCAICSSMVNDKTKKYPESLADVPSKFTKSDFQHTIYPILETLVIFGKELDSKNQTLLVKALQTGLSSRTSQRQCILTLTICIMETQDIMAKVLPELLLSITKISATKHLAVPKLEFLSNLILFSRLYVSFTSEQYMSIFAIVLPYTNSFQFDNYTIALAHRVIAMWFLKCRMIWKRTFVPFIRKNLEQNIKPTEEEFRNRAQSMAGEVKRSPDSFRVHPMSPSHLSAQNVLPVPTSPAPVTPTLASVFSFNSPAPPAATAASDAESHAAATAAAASRAAASDDNLRRELFEACMDLLSRYTYGMCSSVPQKTPFADFLLDKSQSCTWLVGHKLITITTTSCTSRAFHKGLCDSCFRICKSVDGSLPRASGVSGNERSDSESEYHQPVSELRDKETFQQQRRRHQSALNPTLSRSTDPKPANRAFDDLHLDGSQSLSSSHNSNNSCTCWCQGWAEILVRRPTGNTAWMMRIENTLNMPSMSSAPPDMNYADLVNFYSSELHSNPPTARGTLGQKGPLDCQPLQMPPPPEETVIEPTKPIDILQPPGKLRDASGSHAPGFRRTSSSPEIEQSPANVTMGTSPVEVGMDLTNETNVACSPEDKKLMRTASLGKADMTTRPSGNLARAASFSAGKRSSPTKRTVSVEEDKTRKMDVADGAKSSRPLSKQELSLSLQSSGDQQQSQGQSDSQSSPTKSGFKTSPKPKLPLDDISEQPSLPYRDRSSTISVMTPAQGDVRQRLSSHASSAYGQEGFTKITGLDPRFVFLQLFYDPAFVKATGPDRPYLLPKTDAIERAIKVFDLITPYETHKIGVLYVGAGQADDKTAILSNEFGSIRYMEMLKYMGNLIRLKDIDTHTCYVGGLDFEGQDGKFAYCWQDNLTQVVFHVATLMPSKERDPNSNDKMRHIGNDYVCIVYNDSGREFDRNALKAFQVQMACIVVTPLDYNVNKVEIQTDKSLAKIIGHNEPFMISDASLSLYVRQIAIHVNLAALVERTPRTGSDSAAAAHVSNWVERLKQLKRIRNKIFEQGNHAAGGSFGGSSHNEPSPLLRPRAYTLQQMSNSNEEQSLETGECYLPDDFTKYS